MNGERHDRSNRARRNRKKKSSQNNSNNSPFASNSNNNSDQDDVDFNLSSALQKLSSSSSSQNSSKNNSKRQKLSSPTLPSPPISSRSNSANDIFPTPSAKALGKKPIRNISDSVDKNLPPAMSLNLDLLKVSHDCEFQDGERNSNGILLCMMCNYIEIIENEAKTQASLLLSAQSQIADLKSSVATHYSDMENNSLAKPLHCSICIDVISVPHIIDCGHTYCYQCLLAWLTTNKSCPSCRTRVTKVPVLNRSLIECVDAFIKEGEKHGKESKERKLLKRRLLADTEEFNKNLQPWGDLFNGFEANALINDDGDGVMRCPNCAWEVVGALCAGCGLVFEGVSDDDQDDDDDDNDGYPYLEQNEEDGDDDLDDFIVRDEQPIFRFCANCRETTECYRGICLQCNELNELDSDDDSDRWIEEVNIVPPPFYPGSHPVSPDEASSDSESSDSESELVQTFQISRESGSNWARPRPRFSLPPRPRFSPPQPTQPHRRVTIESDEDEEENSNDYPQFSASNMRRAYIDSESEEEEQSVRQYSDDNAIQVEEVDNSDNGSIEVHHVGYMYNSDNEEDNEDTGDEHQNNTFDFEEDSDVQVFHQESDDDDGQQSSDQSSDDDDMNNGGLGLTSEEEKSSSDDEDGSEDGDTSSYSSMWNGRNIFDSDSENDSDDGRFDRLGIDGLRALEGLRGLEGLGDSVLNSLDAAGIDVRGRQSGRPNNRRIGRQNLDGLIEQNFRALGLGPIL